MFVSLIPTSAYLSVFSACIQHLFHISYGHRSQKNNDSNFSVLTTLHDIKVAIRLDVQRISKLVVHVHERLFQILGATQGYLPEVVSFITSVVSRTFLTTV